MPLLDVRLFGAPRFTYDGAPWSFSAPPGCLLLLGCLAVSDKPIPRAALAAALWPDELEHNARSNLRRHLHRLRRTLPPAEAAPWVIDIGTAVTLNADAPLRIDVTVFRDTVESPQTRDEALDLYTGDLLAGFDEEWLLTERERVRARYCRALFEAMQDAQTRRDFVRAAQFAERLLEADEWREDAVRGLMLARYESGDRSAAIAGFERFALHLQMELQAEPMPETLALRDAIVAGLSFAPAGASELAGGDADPKLRERTPLVGRRDELDALVRAWSRAARGLGSTVFLSGEAGIGKSRLAAELASIVEAQGGRTLIGTTALPEHMPYQALVAAAQRGLPHVPRDAIDDVWLAALADVLPEVYALRPGLVPASQLAADGARMRFHEALARYFDALARVRPLLVILEDLHWAQQDTIAALNALARRATASPLLVLVTYRGDEVDSAHPLRRVARSLQSERRATRVLPAPLTIGDVGGLVADVFGSQPLPEKLIAEIARVSEGNPLFVQQLARGYLEGGAGADHRLPIGRVTDAIMSRVARLSPETRGVADVAATAGRDFTIDLVTDAGGFGERLVADALDELIGRQLIRESGAAGIAYTFTHALIASAIYDHTDIGVRPARHRRIALSLQAAKADDASTLGTIAWHFERAGDSDDAVTAYLGAAVAALGNVARNDAARLARRAADLCTDDARRFEALQIAVGARAGGEAVSAWRYEVEQMEAIAQRLQSASIFDALAARTALESQTGSGDSMLASARAMVASAELSGNREHGLTAHVTLGLAERQSGRVDAAETSLRAALAIASEIGEPKKMHELRRRLVAIAALRGDAESALAEIAVARSLLDASDIRERLEIAEVERVLALTIEDPLLALRVGAEYLADAERVADIDAQAKAHALLSFAEHARGDARAMREHSTVAATLFARIDARHGSIMTHLNRSTFELEIGRLDESERALDEAERDTFGAANDAAICEGNRARIAYFRGECVRAHALAVKAVETAEACAEQRLIGESYALLGAVEAELGDHESGFAAFERGIAAMRTAGATRTFADHLCAYAEALLSRGEIDGAATIAHELRALAAVHAPVHPARIAALFASVAVELGDAITARAHEAEARRLLEARIAKLDAIDAAAYRALPFIRTIAGAVARIR